MALPEIFPDALRGFDRVPHTRNGRIIAYAPEVPPVAFG